MRNDCLHIRIMALMVGSKNTQHRGDAVVFCLLSRSVENVCPHLNHGAACKLERKSMCERDGLFSNDRFIGGVPQYSVSARDLCSGCVHILIVALLAGSTSTQCGVHAQVLRRSRGSEARCRTQT